MSHAGMTTVWPPQQPPEKLTYQPVNTGQPGWSTCLSRAAPSSQVSHTRMHPHKHPNTHTLGIFSLGSRGWAWLPLSHIRARLYWCDYITSSHDPPSLHVIRFQEHWAHKPGHVLLCPVCQNNSAVSNTVRLRFHFSLARYCRTLWRVTFPMSTSLQFVNMWAAVLELSTSDESNLDIQVAPPCLWLCGICALLWLSAMSHFESPCVSASRKPQFRRKQRSKDKITKI